MSVEPSTLERSALERKDREELTTIAQALGAKPPSRARKADIVQLILELTGVEQAAATAAETNGRDKEATVVDDGESGTATAGSEPAAAPDEAAAPEATPSGSAPAEEEPPAEWELEFGGTTDVVDTPAPAGADATSNGGNGSAQASGGPDQGGQGGGHQPQGQRRGGGTQTGGAPQAGDGGEGDADANEAGNRRRRRRGRRGKEETPHVEEFSGEPVEVEGLPRPARRGLRVPAGATATCQPDDVYVSVKQTRQFGLRKGDHITGAQPAGRCATRRTRRCSRIDTVNGVDPEQARSAPPVRGPHAAVPRREAARSRPPTTRSNMTARIVDLRRRRSARASAA